MYRIDRYHIEVISIFDLYFDMQTQGIREGFDPRPTGKKSDALPTRPQGLKHALAKFFRNDLGFQTVVVVTNSLTPKLFCSCGSRLF